MKTNHGSTTSGVRSHATTLNEIMIAGSGPTTIKHQGTGTITTTTEHEGTTTIEVIPDTRDLGMEITPTTNRDGGVLTTEIATTQRSHHEYSTVERKRQEIMRTTLIGSRDRIDERRRK